MSAYSYYGQSADGPQGPIQHSAYPGSSSQQHNYNHEAPLSTFASAHQSDHLGGPHGGAFNHPAHGDSERHYDELRQQARTAHNERDRAMYNKQASDYIFLENNAAGRVAPDTIDLHGQYVVEAEHILATRLQAGMQRGEDHLHVIVGKGNHSVNHVPKLKPAVERACTEQGLEWRLEHNEGRIFVNLRGHGAGGMPAPGNVGVGGGYGAQQQQQPYYVVHQDGGQHHGGGGGGGGGGGQGKPGYKPNMKDAKKAAGIAFKLYRSCCTVM